MNSLFNKTVATIYFSKIYCSIIMIICTPLILKALGSEAYGLVGVFAVIRACLMVLEGGIGAVLTRQLVSTYKDRKSFDGFLKIYKKICNLFIAITILIMIFGILSADFFTVHWLKSTLNKDLLHNCIILMFSVAAFRYLESPYRSVILAKEKHALLSFFDIVYSTLSLPLLVVFLNSGFDTILYYFIIQLVAVFIRVIMIVISSRVILNDIQKTSVWTSESSTVLNIKDLILFALQLSFLSLCWIVMTQSDKIVLTNVMPLKEYTYYSLALTVVGVVPIISSPISQYLLPRLTNLLSYSDYDSYGKLFLDSFGCLLCILVPLVCAFFSDGRDILYFWLNDNNNASIVQQYLPWLFGGAAIGVLSNHCFLLLYSKGKMKWNTVYYFLFSLIVIFTNIYIAHHYEAVGTSKFLFFSSLFTLLTWSLFNFVVNFDGFILFVLKLCIPIILCDVLFYWMVPIFECSNKWIVILVLLLKGSLVVLVNYLYLFLLSKYKILDLKLKTLQ